MTGRDERVIETLVAEHGRTFAEEAGIPLRNTPQPLYRTLVMACLLSARIRGSVALATTGSSTGRVRSSASTEPPAGTHLYEGVQRGPRGVAATSNPAAARTRRTLAPPMRPVPTTAASRCPP
jgi:hypothetical protein